MPAPPCFEYVVGLEPPHLVIRLCGELDLGSAEKLDWPSWADLSRIDSLIMDLSRLDFCDVAGLRRINVLGVTATQKGLSVQLRGTKSVIRKIARLSGIGTDWLA